MAKFQKYLEKFDKTEIINLINEGLNISEISTIVDIPYRRLGDMLAYFKIKNPNARHQKHVKHDFFDNIDSEEKSYFLGFILADGCVILEPKKKNGKIYSYAKRLCFCNSINDEEILKKMRDAVSPESTLKVTHNAKGATNRKPQINLRISSCQIINSLIEKNIKPNKTQDINFEFDFSIIPEELTHHFIRGFFDGDGHYSNSSKSLRFISTSLFFMNQISDIFKSKIPGIKTSIRTSQNKNMITYTLILNGGYGKHIEMFNYLYKDATIFLSRKYNKFIPVNTEVNNQIAKG